MTAERIDVTADVVASPRSGLARAGAVRSLERSHARQMAQ